MTVINLDRARLRQPQTSYVRLAQRALVVRLRSDQANGDDAHSEPERACPIGDQSVLSRELGFGRTKVRRARLEFRPLSPPASSATLPL
jgi:hypothetical protein